jgi:tetraacyldisaccharide 4'-kinase
MIRAPDFWWRERGFPARLLAPLGAVYGAIAGRRMSRRGARSRLPVICIGNFVVGGAGKTPFAIEIARRLALLGERPAFLTRGHGGNLAGPVAVKPGHMAGEVGDEALLLATKAPVVVARSRIAGAELIERTGASVIVMDDGLQNPSLAKDLAFAVLDAESGIGNGLCLPAGPLRAPLARQWPCVDALVVMGRAKPVKADAGDLESRAALLRREAELRAVPVVLASLAPDAGEAEALKGRKVVAFAGIGRPAKFFASLDEAGAVLVAAHGFPDHHVFRSGELEGLAAKARAADALLVTTEKDMMRIAGKAAPAPLIAGTPLRALRVSARVEDGNGLDSLLRQAIAKRRT